MSCDSLSTSEARDFLVEKTGKKVTARTVRRWCIKGVTNRFQQRVRLKSQIIGARRYTSRRWIEDFIAELNKEPEWMESEPDKAVSDGPVHMTPAKQRLQDEHGFNYGYKRRPRPVPGVQREG